MSDVGNIGEGNQINQSSKSKVGKSSSAGSSDYNQTLLREAMIKMAIVSDVQKASHVMANLLQSEMKDLSKMQAALTALAKALKHVKGKKSKDIKWSDVPKSAINILNEYGAMPKGEGHDQSYFFGYAKKGELPPGYKEAKKKRKDAQERVAKLGLEAWRATLHGHFVEAAELLKEAAQVRVPPKPIKPANVVKDVLHIMQAAMGNLISQSQSDISMNKLALSQMSQFVNSMLSDLGKGIENNARALNRIWGN